MHGFDSFAQCLRGRKLADGEARTVCILLHILPQCRLRFPLQNTQSEAAREIYKASSVISAPNLMKAGPLESVRDGVGTFVTVEFWAGGWRWRCVTGLRTAGHCARLLQIDGCYKCDLRNIADVICELRWLAGLTLKGPVGHGIQLFHCSNRLVLTFAPASNFRLQKTFFYKTYPSLFYKHCRIAPCQWCSSDGSMSYAVNLRCLKDLDLSGWKAVYDGKGCRGII